MKKTMLLLAVFGLAGSLLAADPWVGTWKLNPAKTKYASVGDWVKEITVTYGEMGDQLTFTAKGTLINGTAFSATGSRPLAGGIVKRQPPNANGMVDYATVIEPWDVYLTYLKDGKQAITEHYVVSKDGKSHTVAVKGTDEKGRPAEALYFFDKQ